MKDDFNQIFSAYRSRIFAYVFAISKSEYIAEEITQEIFIKIWLGRGQLDSIKNLDGYIFKITKNLCLNYLRKIAYNEKMATELIRIAGKTNESTDSRLMLFDYNKLINEAVDSLSPQRKRVYQLSREKELDYEEISAELNLSKNTVKNHLLTAMAIVKTFLIKNGVNSTLLSVLLIRLLD